MRKQLVAMSVAFVVVLFVVTDAVQACWFMNRCARRCCACWCVEDMESCCPSPCEPATGAKTDEQPTPAKPQDVAPTTVPETPVPTPAEKPVETPVQPVPEVKPEVKPEVTPEVKPEVKPVEEPAVKPEEKPAEPPAVKPEEKPPVKPEVKPAEPPAVKPEEKPAEPPAANPEALPAELPGISPETKPAEEKKHAEPPKPETKTGAYDSIKHYDPMVMRQWTDATGKYKIEARFVGVIGDTVRFQKSNGIYSRIQLTKLCAEDQELVHQAASLVTQ
jgi:hypothetical protein